MLRALDNGQENAQAVVCYDAISGGTSCGMLCAIVKNRSEKAQAVVCCDAISILALDLQCSGGAHFEVVDEGLHHLDPVGVLEVEHVFLPFLPPMAEVVASDVLAPLSFS